MDRYCRYQSHPLHRTSSELNKTLNTNYSTNQEIFTNSWEYIYHQSRDLYSATMIMFTWTVASIAASSPSWFVSAELNDW